MTDHLLRLAEFCKGVELSGGTTPHVAMTVASMEQLKDPLDKLWFAGCYALTYNWPMAERVFQEWRPDTFDQDRFLSWTEEHWAGIFLRKERKAVFRKPFFAECAASYLEFARGVAPHVGLLDLEMNYLEAFKFFTGSVKYMGRYIAIRWLEVMRRTFCSEWRMTDVRSDGGEHPRKALALLYPEDAAALLGGNSKREVHVADLAADRCLLDLNLEHGVVLDYYELQSLLCEYKQEVLGRKQYPGKSIDTEMDYHRKIAEYWNSPSDFYRVREECFPAWSRGELNGWTGVRKELGTTVTDLDYTWSDAVYDYRATTDLAHPVLRTNGRTSIL